MQPVASPRVAALGCFGLDSNRSLSYHYKFICIVFALGRNHVTRYAWNRLRGTERLEIRHAFTVKTDSRAASCSYDS